MDVSENSGTPKSSILIGVSSINHPFWGTPIFGNTNIHNRHLLQSYKRWNRDHLPACNHINSKVKPLTAAHASQEQLLHLDADNHGDSDENNENDEDDEEEENEE